MDIARTGFLETRNRKRAIYATIGVALFALAAFGVSRLEPAAPTVKRNTIWIEKVRRGPMVREVRGSGRLVPEGIRWISATTEGRLERILVQPGARVTADTIILQLSDPQQVQSGLDAGLRRRAAEADLQSLEAQLESSHLEHEAALGRLEAEHAQARLRGDADEELAKQGLVADITRKISANAAVELGNRVAFEKRRLQSLGAAHGAQIAAQKATVEQLRALERLQTQRTESLQVRAGIDGVLQQISIEEGQRVTAGTVLAKVVQPEKLKAELRIAETQARDITIGLPAVIDTRNGKVAGSVVRIDPAAQGGTVTIDVAIREPLPRGARPDMTVDGLIEIDRLDDVLFAGRPVNAQEDATVGLFRVDQEGNAQRVRVTIGRTSVSTVEIKDGLAEGDEVILSDMSPWDDHERLRIR